MTPRLSALALAPLLAATTAYAQAPGEVTPEEPTPQPVAQDPCGGGSRVPVMARRWAIGLSFGGLGVAPEGAPDGSETQFRIAELSIRFRASRRIELELGFSGGRQALEDDVEGDLAIGTVTLAARYRFMPSHKWNWFIMAGLGGTVIAPHESSQEQRDDAQRTLGMLGIGIERRFRRFALQAEMRMISLGQREDAMNTVPVVDDRGGMATPPPLVPELDTTRADQLGGGTFTLGASYYF